MIKETCRQFRYLLVKFWPKSQINTKHYRPISQVNWYRANHERHTKISKKPNRISHAVDQGSNSQWNILVLWSISVTSQSVSVTDNSTQVTLEINILHRINLDRCLSQRRKCLMFFKQNCEFIWLISMHLCVVIIDQYRILFHYKNDPSLFFINTGL